MKLLYYRKIRESNDNSVQSTNDALHQLGSIYASLSFCVLITAESSAEIWQVKYIQAPPPHATRWLRLLSVLTKAVVLLLWIHYLLLLP